MKVRLKKDLNKSCRTYGLSLDRIYDVIGVEAGDYRILSDKRSPTLYSQKLFVIIDNTIPIDWIVENGNEGEIYSYPKEFMRVGFFEDYHDGVYEAIKDFNEYLLNKSKLNN